MQLQGSWESSGSYTKLHDIVTAKTNPVECPSGDSHNAIDNNQKVGICIWKIREGSTVPLSICTTLGHLFPQPPTYYQNDQNLMPKNWLNTNPLSEIREKVDLLEKKSTEGFRNYRGQYIEEIIAIVSDEVNDNLRDCVDVAVTNN